MRLKHVGAGVRIENSLSLTPGQRSTDDPSIGPRGVPSVRGRHDLLVQGDIHQQQSGTAQIFIDHRGEHVGEHRARLLPLVDAVERLHISLCRSAQYRSVNFFLADAVLVDGLPADARPLRNMVHLRGVEADAGEQFLRGIHNPLRCLLRTRNLKTRHIPLPLSPRSQGSTRLTQCQRNRFDTSTGGF